MINFDEELKKFKPSLDVDEAEGAIYSRDITDVIDILKDSPASRWSGTACSSDIHGTYHRYGSYRRLPCSLRFTREYRKRIKRKGGKINAFI